MGEQLCGGENVIDIVYLEGVGGGEGETGPDNRGRVEGRDEEGQFAGGNVVSQVAVWEGTTGEVEEVASLSVGGFNLAMRRTSGGARRI